MAPKHAWLAVLLAALSPGLADAWETDYGKALQKSRQDGKPILVVIGRGEKGWQQLLTQSWSVELLDNLRQGFHPVYVDADDAEYGGPLARMFNFQALPAMVISDRYGRTQLVRREGQLTHDQFLQLLSQYGAIPSSARGSMTVRGNDVGSRQLAPVRTPASLCPT